jgi:carboxylesterase
MIFGKDSSDDPDLPEGTARGKRRREMAPIMPGAGGYYFEGGSVGCLLLHGFTGTPQNVRPLADYLQRRGLTVSVPRIAGHGTSVDDLDATGPDDWLGTAEAALAELRGKVDSIVVGGISLGGTYTLELARRHRDLLGIVVMAAPVLDIPALAEVVQDPNRPKAITAPWASVGALTSDIASGGITYMEMPLDALERGLGLVRRVREGLAEVTCPTLLIYGDHDAIVDKANGPYVLEHLGSADKRLLPLDDSAHEITLDYGKERIMVEVHDFIRRLVGAGSTGPAS